MVWLHNSRVLATFAVIILHTSANVVVHSDIGSEYWWIGNIFNSLFRWCIPVFVMISGALLLDSSKNKEELISFYEKRFSKIFVPIMFWSVFFLLFNVLKELVVGDKGYSSLYIYLFKQLIKGEPHYHMWFLYMIITLYLFTPFFRRVVECSTRREIKLLVVFTFLMAAINSIYRNLFPIGSELFIFRFLSYIPFFLFGHLILTCERNLSKTILWGVFLFSSGITAIGCFIFSINKNLHAGLYFYDYLSISVIPMSVSIMYLLKLWTKPIYSEKYTISLSSLTLGVYLIHPIFLNTIQYFGFDPLKYYPAVSIPVIVIFVFCSSLIASWLIYKVPYLKRVI